MKRYNNFRGEAVTTRSCIPVYSVVAHSGMVWERGYSDSMFVPRKCRVGLHVHGNESHAPIPVAMAYFVEAVSNAPLLTYYAVD